MKHHPCYECYPDIATGSSQGMHNAHPDVAFAAYSFRNAVRFARLLGVDSAMSMLWQAALDNMPDYPSADFTFMDGAVGSEFNGGAGFLVEAEYGYQPGVLPNGSSVAPPLWPWCNKEYPIANFAAMWPTDEIGATQTDDKALLARAKQTVYGLNDYQAKPWANNNGFCLSWPPAVRVSGKEDSKRLITSFATGIDSTTASNGCVVNKGGMLENIGATVAINDLLLQSHGGRMRFFPAWNATVLGGASFTTLRAYGAFLVSASIDSHGVVSPVSLASEVGGDVVFDSPWPDTTSDPVITDDKGKVPVENIEAAADTVLRLVVGRDLVGIPTIRYASHATGGAGELHDSAPTVADANYEYLPDEGMPDEANIEALVDKPYPLYNWSIAFEVKPSRGHDSAR